MKTSASIVLLVLTGVFISSHTTAQVNSVTLSIQTHCPYGIKGCWPEIRDGLEAPEEIAAINKGPDSKTGTCEVQMRASWFPDPDFFAHNFTNMHIGVDVRGVEVVVEGSLEKFGTNLVLRLGERDTLMRLAPLTRKVQWNSERKQPEAMTDKERDAFQALAEKSQAKGQPVRITGPLRNGAEALENGSKLVLEVRNFELKSK